MTSMATSPVRPTRPVRRLARALIAVIAALMFVVAGCAQTPAPGGAAVAKRTVTDMEGRSVEIPQTVTKVVTLGSVPVINSFLFALGKGDLIVNGLPANFVKDDRWKLQYTFAPQIKDLPKMQGADSAPLAEEIAKAAPDFVLTMLPAHAEQLGKIGIPTIVLRWQNDEDVKKVVSMLGDALGVPDRAAEYVKTFDGVVGEVGALVEKVPAGSGVSALSLDPTSMGQPHAIAQWWIAKAGGRPVTEGNAVESLKFNAEQVVSWDPQVIFVNDLASIPTTLGNAKLAPVAAIGAKKVYAMPIGAHLWGNRTSEQPLSVAYAAHRMYPDKVSAKQLAAFTKRFYADAFHAELTDAQVQEILGGR